MRFLIYHRPDFVSRCKASKLSDNEKMSLVMVTFDSSEATAIAQKRLIFRIVKKLENNSPYDQKIIDDLAVLKIFFDKLGSTTFVEPFPCNFSDKIDKISLFAEKKYNATRRAYKNIIEAVNQLVVTYRTFIPSTISTMPV
jgi:hypothetical protein